MQSKCKIICLSFLMVTLSACGKPRLNKPLVQENLNNMTFISSGAYMMGSSNPEISEVAHKIILSPFYISKFNVSWKEYDQYTQIMGKSYLDLDGKKLHASYRQPNRPVDSLTWYQANNYCQHLKKVSGLPYELPTEAQWEYVARNNGKPNWYFPTNNGKQELGENFPSFKQLTAGNDGEAFALPVGSLPCTPQGICGLTGEVNQWMKDWYDASYYSHSPAKDPQGPTTGILKIIRGSSPDTDDHTEAYVFRRYGKVPSAQWAGVRCAINSAKPMSELKAIAMKHLS